MFTACYILAGLLSIWGGCLVARVLANRLEHGLFRRRARAAGADPTWTPPIRRSGWWAWIGVIALAIGVAAGVVAAQAELEMTWGGWGSPVRRAGLAAFLTLLTLGLGMGMGLVGLRFDPSRGRRRCPKCWYDLSATTGRLCPECGHESPSERRLFSTRRSRGTVALGLCVLLAVPVGMRVRGAVLYGWIGAVPTSLLIPAWALAPSIFGDGVSSVAGGVSGPRPGGLLGRINRGEVWRWQAAWVVHVCRRTLEHSEDARELLGASQIYNPARAVARDELTVAEDPPGMGRPGLVLKLLDQLVSPDPGERATAAALLPFFGSAFQGTDPDTTRLRAAMLDVALGADDVAGTCALQAAGWVDMRDQDLDRLAEAVRSPTVGAQRRWWMVSILARRESRSGGRLVRALEDPDERVRGMLLETAGGMVDTGPIREKVLSAIASDTPGAAGRAALGLARIWHRDRAERDVILARARRDTASAGAMAPALDLLLGQGRMPGTDMASVLPALVDALGSANDEEVGAALRCLSRMDAGLLGTTPGLPAAVHRVADDPGRSARVRVTARTLWIHLPGTR